MKLTYIGFIYNGLNELTLDDLNIDWFDII